MFTKTFDEQLTHKITAEDLDLISAKNFFSYMLLRRGAFRRACIWIWFVFVYGLHTCESCASSSVQGKWGASECNPKWGKIPDAIFLFYRAGLPPLYFLFPALTVLVFPRLWSVWSGAWRMFCIKVALEAPLDLPPAIKVIFPMFLLQPWVGSRQSVLEYGHALV